MIDYIEGSSAVLSLLIFLAFKYIHTHTHTYKERVRSHQSGNNILLRRPFTAHSHKSLRQSHHPHCQHVIMCTHTHSGQRTSQHTFIQFSQSCYPTIKGCHWQEETWLESKLKTQPQTHFTCDDSLWPCLKHTSSQQPLCALALRTGHSSVTGCRDEGMKGWEALKGKVRNRWKPLWLRSQGAASRAGGRCDLVGCRSTRARKRRTMKVSVALVAAAGGREERGWQIRRSDRQNDGGRERQHKECKRWRWDFKQRIGPRVQRDTFLSGMEEEGTEGPQEGWMAQTSQHQSLLSHSSHADVYITLLTFAQSLRALPISLYILMSTSLSVWICIYMRQ